ncbi:L-lactate permease [Desmospora profundinema]|uniref:L-lactate permease n=1 Tax=Desmospora profundinema TaxID=1571184 RepID=A0ABU1IMC0_9BACL|nr:L-lactate permease [Desmospora profundinema]MDR6225697.1 lactate permease [Desmospora profundinema]
MEVFLAISPIIAVLILLFVLKQSIVRAGFMGCILALLVGIGFYQLQTDQLAFPFIKGTLTTSTVAYFLLFGIFLFHLMNEKGVIRSFAAMVAQSTHDPVRQVLILAVAFSPLVESASGFGLAAIVISPILIALGFGPFKATLISLVSLSAVPWGSLAAGTVIGANLAGITPQALGTGTALLSLPTFIYFAIVIAYLAGGWDGLKRRFVEVIITSATLGVSVWAFTTYVGVELAGVFGALCALSVELIMIQVFRERQDVVTGSETAAAMEERAYGKIKSLSPYLFLIGLLLISRLFPVLENALKNHAVLSFPEYQFSLPLLYSPGFFLLLACGFTIFLFQIRLPMIRTSAKNTFKHWTPVIVSTLFFVIMAEIMSQAGMIEVLSETAADVFGTAFLYMAPLIGGLGGFLAGSNTGSNSMFIKLQVQTAQQLGLSEHLVAYAQNTSSSHLIMANPSRIVLGATIGGIQSEESRLLKKIVLVALGTLTIITLEMAVAQLFMMNP